MHYYLVYDMRVIVMELPRDRVCCKPTPHPPKPKKERKEEKENNDA
jgi:hypothetical protein